MVRNTKSKKPELATASTATASEPKAGADVVDVDEKDQHPGGVEVLSDAGSYASYQSDGFDPALFDEEEVPDEGFTASTSTDGLKGKPTFAGGYNAMKSFGGQMYSGMAIGGSHIWYERPSRVRTLLICGTRNYQPGVWKETKKEPDLWEIDYKTNKVRNHKAPANSGAPVGTEYHWYIVAHQMVKKIDANTYETHLMGHKYKLTHKNVNQKNWAIPTVKGQREREIFLLEDAKRRVEGLPPVLSNEKVKVDKKEKGQATLGSFFGSPSSSPKKRKAEEAIENGAKSGPSKKIR